MNNYRAIIEESVPPSMTIIAAGDKEFCDKHLAIWIEKFPLDIFQTGMVVEVVSTIETSKDLG